MDKSLGEIFERVLHWAAEYHDLGKLHLENQSVLNGNLRGKLAVNHIDAAIAYLAAEKIGEIVPAFLIAAHHRPGLRDVQAEFRGDRTFPLRDADAQVRSKVDRDWEGLLQRHRESVKLSPCAPTAGTRFEDLRPLFFRFALSCLVDADHSDTAIHYREHHGLDEVPTRWRKRLANLNKYVSKLKSKDKLRGEMRRNVYKAAKAADTKPAMYSCDSPVGTGKTTAVMAHLLRAAQDKNLRRIFVVLPFITIINQSVKTYRKSLRLAGESEKLVVAAHHSRAEFDGFGDEPSAASVRKFSFLWEAPVVVTSAVQFFETLAGAEPARLRKLHRLVGSAIFIDESHAALPAPLWPLAWEWLRELTTRWGCHVVLASGSSTKFWNFTGFVRRTANLPELVEQTKKRLNVRSAAQKAELKRVSYKVAKTSAGEEYFSLQDLIRFIKSKRGPRLVIANTVQNAAVIADRMQNERVDCLHLSTALCPKDREKVLELVSARLEATRKGKCSENWNLVATSCVEAGVDFDFSTGFRERCSLVSLLQTAGRVNRDNDWKDSVVYDFQVRAGEPFTHNKQFNDSIWVLSQLWRMKRPKGQPQIQPAYCEEAFTMEVKHGNAKDQFKDKILKEEDNFSFPFVAENFKVITDETLTAIVNKDLRERIERGEKVGFREIQDFSVSVHEKYARYLAPVRGFADVKAWTLEYDDFLGYTQTIGGFVL